MSGESSEGRPILIEHECDSGVMAHITPISFATLRAIQLKAEDKFPYPAPEPYQVPDPEDVAFNPDQTSRAEDNPQYVAACKAVDDERDSWVDRAVFDYTVRFPKYPTKDDVLTAFADQLKKLREIAKLPEDNYDAILLHVILSGNELGKRDDKHVVMLTEFVQIVRLAIRISPLTAGEVQQGARMFRAQISKSTN